MLADCLDLEGAVKFRNAVDLFLLPFGKRRIGTLQAREVNARAVGPSDNAVFREVIRDVKHTVAVFDFGWPSNQDFGFEWSPHSPPLPLLNTAEQLRNGPCSFQNDNGINALTAVPFLPSAPSERQTVAPHIGQIPDPANDNDDWREAA